VRRASQFVRQKVTRTAKRRGKKNPAAESLEAYKEFHGRDADEIVHVKQKVHFHKHLAGAGKLEYLVIDAVDKVHRVTLRKFNGALLAFNENGTQLFIVGGSQAVNLRDFGIQPDREHEVETLGKAVQVGYYTRKDHLMKKDGGTAIYEHDFVNPRPSIIYRVRDQQLEFSGGSYVIKPEGIVK
jgi:hypothetical protein